MSCFPIPLIPNLFFFFFWTLHGTFYTMPNGKLIKCYTVFHWHPQALIFMTSHILLVNWQGILEHDVSSGMTYCTSKVLLYGDMEHITHDSFSILILTGSPCFSHWHCQTELCELLEMGSSARFPTASWELSCKPSS